MQEKSFVHCCSSFLAVATVVTFIQRDERTPQPIILMLSWLTCLASFFPWGVGGCHRTVSKRCPKEGGGGIWPMQHKQQQLLCAGNGREWHPLLPLFFGDRNHVLIQNAIIFFIKSLMSVQVWHYFCPKQSIKTKNSYDFLASSSWVSSVKVTIEFCCCLPPPSGSASVAQGSFNSYEKGKKGRSHIWCGRKGEN